MPQNYFVLQVTSILLCPTDICYSPVYVYPHSKAVLMRAIQEDTQFLAQNAIMDYSLLTCIDDRTGELVVGIIGSPQLMALVIQ